MKSSQKRNMNSVLLVTVSVIVGACSATAVIFALSLFGDGGTPTDAGTNVGSLEPIHSVQSGTTADRNEPGVGSTRPTSPSTSIQSLEELGQYKSPFERSIALHVLLSNVNRQQALELLKESKDVELRNRSQAQAIILQRLAQLNPQLALAQFDELDIQYSARLLASIFSEWAHTNLDDAVSHASSLDDREKFSVLDTILRERTELSEEKRRQVARQLGNEQIAINLIVQEKVNKSTLDPEKAWNELVDELQRDTSQSWTLVDLANKWVNKSGVDVLDQISVSLTNSQARINVLTSVLRTVAETDPEGAFQFALALDRDPHDLIISGVVNQWARLNPKAALDAAAQVEKSGLRQRLERSVVSTWGYFDPQDVLENLDLLADHLQDSAINSAVSAMVQKEPGKTAEFVAGMENGTSKTNAALTLVRNWSNQDPESALEWILNEQGVQDVKHHLLPQILYQIVEVDPQLAIETALAQPIREHTTGLEASVIATLAYTDFDKALEFLPQVRDGPTKIAAYSSIGASYIQNGETEKALNLAQQLSESNRTAYLRGLLPEWAGSDPQDLLESMDRLPTAEIKSKAAMVLTAYNDWEKNLTDEEIERVKKYLTEEDAETLEKGDLNVIFDL